MCSVAAQHKCYITYSALVELEDGTKRNCMQLIDRSGTVIGVYYKNHLTKAEMDRGVLCGSEAPVFHCDFGSVVGAICFDLNFDELRLKYKALHPDMILFSSMFHGGLLQKMWAFTCRSHFVGAISPSTPSSILSPLGETIASSTNYYPYTTARVNLDCAVVHLDFNKSRLFEAKKKYGPKFRVYDPGQLGSVLISSESDELSIQEIIAEFGIELLDDYLQRSLDLQHLPENRAG